MSQWCNFSTPQIMHKILEFISLLSLLQQKVKLLLIADVKKNFFVPLLLLCSENNQKNEWTKTEHIEISFKILNLIKLRIFKVSSVFEILISDSDKMLRWCLEELRPKLMANSWKKNPGAQRSFVWVLHQVCY